MNNKRQTIWLVSMLSLMVILSAYYLFTEDVSTPTKDIVTTDGAGAQGAKGDVTEASGAAGDDNSIIVDNVTGDTTASSDSDITSGDAATNTADAADSHAGTANDGTATADGTSAGTKSDEQILSETEAGGLATSVFSQLQEERDATFNEQYDKLMGELSNNKDDKDVSGPVDQLNSLDDKNAKITGLEDELSKQFHNVAVVNDIGNHYKIVVQSDKLERSQADGILTLAMKELSLTPEQLTIQFVK